MICVVTLACTVCCLARQNMCSVMTHLDSVGLPQVSALLTELGNMKAADPAAKAVVFSTWSRLLRLVDTALKDNGIQVRQLTHCDLQGDELK